MGNGTQDKSTGRVLSGDQKKQSVIFFQELWSSLSTREDLPDTWHKAVCSIQEATGVFLDKHNKRKEAVSFKASIRKLCTVEEAERNIQEYDADTYKQALYEEARLHIHSEVCLVLKNRSSVETKEAILGSKRVRDYPTESWLWILLKLIPHSRFSSESDARGVMEKLFQQVPRNETLEELKARGKEEQQSRLAAEAELVKLRAEFAELEAKVKGKESKAAAKQGFFQSDVPNTASAATTMGETPAKRPKRSA